MSLMNITMKTTAGGRITFQDCGRMTRSSVRQKPKFSACAASTCWRGTDSKPPRMISERKAVESRQIEISAMANSEALGAISLRWRTAR